MPLNPTVGNDIHVMALSHVGFSLHSSVTGVTLYIATSDAVNSSASKQIKYQSGTHRNGTIVFTEDYSGGKTRWISDNGILN